MNYQDELESHKAFQWLSRARDWYRASVLLPWPEWMPGTEVLAWRLDKKMFLMQQAIESRIYSRRLDEYRGERWRLRGEHFDRLPIERFGLAKHEADRIMAYK